ncbi:MAG TPA: efflux RND transporter periplasmic adaptor subunit [Candidatus Paceibacterota bacterium]|nr:efflux RND transporter periplasmic adaptor subunit [Candidatus Paceibacterota bacterium]
MSDTITELLSHTFVRAALGIVALILVGSVAYYAIASRPPALTYASVTEGPITEDVTGTGTVSPVENPDLSFAVGGKVSAVRVAVGDTVTQGELLANLDTGVLSANLAAAEATYAGVTAGPRDVDLAGKRTALAQANASVDNSYASLSSVIAGDLASGEDAVHSTDVFFGSFNVVDYPRLNFLTGASQAADTAGRERGALQKEFPLWNEDIAALTASTSPEELDTTLESTIDHLIEMRTYFDNLTTAATDPRADLSASEIATITTGRSTVNALVLALQTEQQTLVNEKLAAEAAEDALNLTQAGATTQAVAVAAAQVHAAEAALGQAEIVAPFSGTIASVHVKSGDIVTPNQPSIAILPDSNFEVDIYLSEIDAAKVAVGAKADVTLDAYGSGTVFPATVASVDRAATIRNGVPAYKVTLVFTEKDPKLSSGLGANAVIHVGASADTLVVPSGAVVTEGNQTYVLKQTPQGPVKTPVVVGLVGATSTEIISGVSVGDSVARVAGN